MKKQKTLSSFKRKDKIPIPLSFKYQQWIDISRLSERQVNYIGGIVGLSLLLSNGYEKLSLSGII